MFTDVAAAMEPHRDYELDLSQVIPPEEWAVQRPVIVAAQEQGIPFALGGGMAFSLHAGRARNTKDMDLFVLKNDIESLKAILTREGFTDYYERLPYDRSWIYRGYKDGVIMDLIWEMPNHRLTIRPSWHTRAPIVPLYDLQVPLLPAEDSILSKLYVLQNDRCDWPDLLNILCRRSANLDWRFLLSELDSRDKPLLGGLLAVFGWMCNETARTVPGWVWQEVGISPPEEIQSETTHDRAMLLDSRDWFGPRPTK